MEKLKMITIKNRPTSWLQGARTETMPEWIRKNTKAFRLLYEFAERSSRKKREIEYNGVLIQLNEREFISGRISTSTRSGITQQEYRTLYARFEKLGYIKTIKRTNKFTVALYLSDGIFYNNPNSNQPERQPAKSPSINQQLTTNNNLEKIKKSDISNIAYDKSKSKYLASEILNRIEPNNSNLYKMYLYFANTIPENLLYQWASEVEQDKTIKNRGAVFNSKANEWLSRKDIKND